MEAFSSAIALGVSHLETDLRITSDGKLVCHHDPSLSRTTDGVGLIANMEWSEVARLDAGFRHRTDSGFSFRDSGVTIPLFEEVVTSFPEVAVVAELKADGMAEELARLIDAHRLHDRVIVGSFSDARLAEFREASRGKVRTSTGMAATRRWATSFRAGRRVDDGATALQVPVQSRGFRVVDERLVRVAHEAGLDVHVWTVNDVSEMARLLDLGVDGLITDRPDLAQELLASRVEAL